MKTGTLSPEHKLADAPTPQNGGQPAHLAELPGGGWALWRTLILRGTGFPARSVLRLAAPDSSAEADRILQLEERLEAHLAAALQAVHDALDRLRRNGCWSDKELRKPLVKAMQALTRSKLPKNIPEPSCAPAFEALRAARDELDAARAEFIRIYQTEVAHVSEEIADVARDARFREAVLWQNRHAVENNLAELAAKPADSAARTSKRRKHEELAASYLQRYCTKNDTIGFFGPVAFSHLADEGDAISARCGADLIQQRTVYFEAWCIEALAESLGRNPALRPWLAPRLKSSFHLEGAILHRPFGKPAPLPPSQARLIARCDGRTTACDIARDLISDPSAPFSTEDEVYRLIESLCQARVLTWALLVPPDLHPDQKLAALLARIEPEPLRIETTDALRELQRARDGVALAAGNPPALETALRDLESTFTRLTGRLPRHRQGQTYAARSLVYEDCRRDADVVFGPALMRRLGPPLRLLLRSGRWLAGEMARRLDLQLRALHARLRHRAESNTVDCPTFFTSALSEIFFHRDRKKVLEEIEQVIQARWSRVLGPLPAGARHVRFSTQELEGRFAAAFEDAGPAWTLTRYFSPDVMIAADGEAAFLKGDFELVLGEVHSGNTLIQSCFISQHPAPDQLHRLLELDAGSSIIVMPQALQQGWPRRVTSGVNLPSWYNFHFADHLPSGPDERRLSAGELVIEETDGALRARTRDGRIAFHPVDLFSQYLTNECSPRINDLLGPTRHKPRMSFDDLVISRERWQLTAGELEFATIRNVEDRFLALRRWAKALGLPRFCFFKTEIERKPCYLDFDSPISGDIFTRFVRTARESGFEVKVTISEMSPRLDQAWLRDGSGNLYTCELRFAALELR